MRHSALVQVGLVWLAVIVLVIVLAVGVMLARGG